MILQNPIKISEYKLQSLLHNERYLLFDFHSRQMYCIKDIVFERKDEPVTKLFNKKNVKTKSVIYLTAINIQVYVKIWREWREFNEEMVNTLIWEDIDKLRENFVTKIKEPLIAAGISLKRVSDKENQ